MTPDLGYVKPRCTTIMPAKTSHFAWTGSETVVQLHGTGPWEITQVNQAGDPRTK